MSMIAPVQQLWQRASKREQRLLSLAAAVVVDGLLLHGGGDIDPQRYGGNISVPSLYDISPERDETEIFLARQTVKQELPLLAICRGNQIFNVALGGTLWEDIGTLMPGAMRHDYYRQFPRNHTPHEVRVTPGTTLARLLDTECTPVNSLHHQGIRELATELTAAASLNQPRKQPPHPGIILHQVFWVPLDPQGKGVAR